MPFMFLPVLATAISAASSVGSFAAGQRQARDLRREGNRLADDAIARGEFEADRYERDLNLLLGRQRTQLAGQGVDVTQGTAAILAEQTEDIGMEDIAEIRANALREAYAIRRGARNASNQARMQSYSALGNAFGSLASLGANAWDTYSRQTAKVAGTTTTMAGKMPRANYGPSYGPPTP